MLSEKFKKAGFAGFGEASASTFTKNAMLNAPIRALTALILAAAVVCSVGLMTSTAHAKTTISDAALKGEILLRLRSTRALNPLLKKYPLKVVSQFGRRPIYRLVVTGTAASQATIKALTLEIDVLAAEANPTLHSPEGRRNAAWAIGEKSGYAKQWASPAVRLGAARKLSTGSGVRIAVLDTGVDPLHPRLSRRLIPGWDFVDDDNDPSEVGSAEKNPVFGHGTHVSGLVSLVAPGARIMPVRVLDTNGIGNAWVLVEALLYAVDPDGNPGTDDGAQVINLSLGTINRTRILRTAVGLATCAVVDAAAEELGLPVDPDLDISDPGYDDDKDRCGNFHGAVVVIAAGNDGSKKVRQYPAGEGVYGMVSVGASDKTGHTASFSNYGSWVDIAAPGEGITSLLPVVAGSYGTWSGTSMAAPFVTGTAALVIARYPRLQPRDITRRIERRSKELCDDDLRQVDAAAALGKAKKNVACK